MARVSHAFQNLSFALMDRFNPDAIFIGELTRMVFAEIALLYFIHKRISMPLIPYSKGRGAIL